MADAEQTDRKFEPWRQLIRTSRTTNLPSCFYTSQLLRDACNDEECNLNGLRYNVCARRNLIGDRRY